MRLKWIGVLVAVPTMVAAVAWYRHKEPLLPGALKLNVAAGQIPSPWKEEIEGAHEQAAKSAAYNASYVRIPYPGGDVPETQGACTDVVIRSLRHAGFDLQKLIHEDMVARPSAYPRYSKSPDTNIDHRRVPNQVAFLEKFGQKLTNEVSPSTLSQWHGGDIVYWKLPFNHDHTGVVSDMIGPSGNPTVIHNIAGCTEEDCLTDWKIVGHYRYPPDRR